MGSLPLGAQLGSSTQHVCPHLRHFVYRPRAANYARNASHKTYAVGWDPEGILRAPQGGHIARRNISKEVENNKELQKEVDRLKIEKEKELQAAREARRVPETADQIVEYLLETEAGEMQYETARLRPLLTDGFFSHLSGKISDARFASPANEERTAELESLKEFLQNALRQLDSRASELSAPADRMRKLLTAPDKKQMLLDMAENNEIDKALLDLLNQNIRAAQAAGQPQAAEFMEKIHNAARKFVLVP